MMKYKNLFLLIAAFLLLIACEDYVTDVDPLIDAVENERLDAESQVNFLISGVQTQFAEVQGAISCLSGDLSDELIYSANLQGASFPSFQEIDEGDIQLDNNSVDGVFNNLGELRLFADDLVERTGRINFSDEALKNKALFTGKFYGAIARYFYACYFGLNPEQGGGVIDNGPFIPSADLYNQALDLFTEALTYATDNDVKITHTLMARTSMYKGDYAGAAGHAAQGLAEGDAPFQALYSTTWDNYWWGFAGAGRTQLGADFRFIEYIKADPNEANRIVIVPTAALDTTLIAPYNTYYRQDLYPEQTSPMNVATWQENNLMLAELALRGHGSGDALALVNAVRASHGIDPLAAVDLDVIYTERDKELFTTGARLNDQRRFGKWHLPAGKWQYLPITRRERNNNPNID